MKRRRKDQGLFWPTCRERGYLQNGTGPWSDVPVQRELTRAELGEAYRLWVKHADIREGRRP